MNNAGRYTDSYPEEECVKPYRSRLREAVDYNTEVVNLLRETIDRCYEVFTPVLLPDVPCPTDGACDSEDMGIIGNIITDNTMQLKMLRDSLLRLIERSAV